MGKAIDIVNQLRVVEFDWKTDGRHDVGMIAEEVEKVYPEAVYYTDLGKVEGLKPLTLIALVVKAIQELDEKRSTHGTIRFTKRRKRMG